MYNVRITVRCASSYSEMYYSETLNCEYLTTDSRSYEEDSENVESTTTIPTDRKRKKTAGNVAMHVSNHNSIFPLTVIHYNS